AGAGRAPGGRTGGAAPGAPGRGRVVGWGEGGGAAGRRGCRALPVLRRWPSDRIVPAATATRTADVGSMVQRTSSRGTGGKGSSPTARGPLVSDSGRGRLDRGRLGCRRHAAGAGAASDACNSASGADAGTASHAHSGRHGRCGARIGC